jgi:hypothetical protein
MICPHDHSDKEGLPEFLCRICHPDTAAERRRLDREIRELEAEIERRPRPELSARLQELQLAELCL